MYIANDSIPLWIDLIGQGKQSRIRENPTFPDSSLNLVFITLRNEGHMPKLETGIQFHLPTYAHVPLPHLIDLAKKEVNLSIYGGDIGVLYIIQDELLRNPKTEFAGVITKHPLTDELNMRVISSNPLKDIIKATDTVIEGAAELKKLSVSKIKVN